MREVEETVELRRVRELPRRVSELAPEVVNAMTEALRVLDRCPGAVLPGVRGLCSVCRQPLALRPRQALALHDAAVYGGAFCNLDVGHGKTLIALLVPYVLDAQRPLLLLPAGLVKKTDRDRAALALHWKVPTNIRILSLEMLGRVQAAAELANYAADLYIVDEAHRLKNHRAAVTRRVARDMKLRPETRMVALSGTFMTKSIVEFGPVLRWCLKENSPVPSTAHELDDWAGALDEDVSGRPGDELGRLEPGALLSLCSSTELAQTPLTAARQGFRRRLEDTPGVISSASDEAHLGSLQIRAVTYPMPPEVDAAFDVLRGSRCSPADHWPLVSGAEVWADARELALGVTYTWDPRPPEEWLRPRRDWHAFVREIISRSRTLDSAEHVAQAVASGRIDDGGRLRHWEAVEKTFVPHSVPVWFSGCAIEVCAAWAARPGIIWTEHEHFAQRLAEATGLAYYGRKGIDREGRFIDDAQTDRAIIASSDANREGRNLQHWSRNLITSPAEGSGWWQQVLGRTHRSGQRADEVEVDVLLGCLEHANAWRKANAAARAVRDTTGAQSKLLIADVDWPTDLEIEGYQGGRWRAPKRERFQIPGLAKRRS